MDNTATMTSHKNIEHLPHYCHNIVLRIRAIIPTNNDSHESSIRTDDIDRKFLFIKIYNEFGLIHDMNLGAYKTMTNTPLSKAKKLLY